MIVHDFTKSLDHQFHGSIAAIGNFDAVHRGHQALFEIARKRALHLGTPFSVLTFEPHPRSFFTKDKIENFRVTPHTVKHDLLMRYGADIVFSLPFNDDIAQLTAEQFISSILKDKLKLKGIVCGYDFHFGNRRTGSIIDLKNSGLDTIEVGTMKNAQNEVYSATRIREHIKNGDIQSTNELLGWDWFIRGTVVHGDKRGRTIGFPTLNTPMGETIAPRYGVYASLMRHQNKIYKSISNIGIRPMFALPTPIVETYVFDFDHDIYDEQVDIIPIQFIRDEMKFSSLDELKSQITTDCKTAQSILESYHA